MHGRSASVAPSQVMIPIGAGTRGGLPALELDRREIRQLDAGAIGEGHPASLGLGIVDQRGDDTARRVMPLDRVGAVNHGLRLTPVWHRPKSTPS